MGDEDMIVERDSNPLKGFEDMISRKFWIGDRGNNANKILDI